MNVGAMNDLSSNTPAAVPRAHDITIEMNPADEQEASTEQPLLPRRTVSAKKSSLDEQPLKSKTRPAQANDPSVASDADTEEAAAHLAAIERLQSQLSAARSQARAAQDEARTARSEAAAAKSDLARTERLLSSITKERDDALLRAEAAQKRRSSVQEQLNRELDVMRREAEASEAKSRAMYEQMRALRGELYRVSVENEMARNDARVVLKSLDELREKRGVVGEAGAGSKQQNTKRGSRIFSALGLRNGGRRRSSAEGDAMYSAAQQVRDSMQGSEGSLQYSGPELYQHQHQHQQQRMHASFESLPYNHAVPRASMHSRRRAHSAEGIMAPTLTSFGNPTSELRQRPGMIRVGNSGKQGAPAAACPTPAVSRAARIAAARGCSSQRPSSLVAPPHQPQQLSRPSYQPSEAGGGINKPLLQAQYKGKSPAYISNVREVDLAKCYTPSVA